MAGGEPVDKIGITGAKLGGELKLCTLKQKKGWQLRMERATLRNPQF